MNRLNLFTSSSESRIGNRRPLANAFYTLVCVTISLVLIDVLISVVFAYPNDPKRVPSALQLYFDYGRSVEGKLRRETRANPAETAPITLTGWYDPLEVGEPLANPEKQVVTIYGMSHANRLGQALNRVSNQFAARSVGAPGATPNWAYGAYLRDRGGGKSRAVVLAFMSANFMAINTMSSMTWNVDMPAAYTADRFVFDREDRLRVVDPPYASFHDYALALADPRRWRQALDDFAGHDTMYNSLLVRANPLDRSSLFRLLRRAYSQRYFRQKRKEVLDPSGFNPQSEQVQVARAMVRDFASSARGDGVVPVIYIVNNFGYSDYLFEALKPALEADQIPYVSSHTIVSPDDPRGYLPDSHFTDSVDLKLAHALEQVIQAAEVDVQPSASSNYTPVRTKAAK
jgi:hypothetical protein